MKKITLFMSALLFAAMSFATEVTVSIADYATANGWENGTAYNTLNMDDVVTVTANPTQGNYGNTGKYYTNGTNWRMYQNEAPEIVVTAAEGCQLTSVTFTYLSEKTGVIVDAAGTKVESGVAVALENVGSATFSVSNTKSDVTNGQARITAITVVYLKAGETPETPDTPTEPEEPETPVEPEEPETPEVTGMITCAEAATIAAAENYLGTEDVTVYGYVVELGNAKADGSKQCFYMSDTKDGEKQFYAYWAFVPQLFEVGNYVTVTGPLKNYNGTIEIVDGQAAFLGETPSTPDTPVEPEEPETPVEPEEPETPAETTTIAEGLALADNATCVLNQFTVIYVAGSYIYIEDESAYALLYQYNFGLKAGDKVTGLEVTKSTYQDIPQFKPVSTSLAGLTIVAGDAPAIDEITSAPTVADNHFVKLLNVTLPGAIVANATVVATCSDNTTINIYSKSDFAIEEGKAYNIIGGVTQYKGNIQIQAYEVEEYKAETTGVEDITVNEKVAKVIKNGQIYIIKGGKTYNALGAEVK